MNTDDAADQVHDDDVVRTLDDEVEARAENAERDAAKRRASGISAEQLSLMDARIAGAECGQRGSPASWNPYQDFTPEHHEWERCRLQALSQTLARLVA